ncbi:hypothetical protein CVT26_014691 [Gymnopilus dilepis]|uniref:Uncharacterized protein n=1 Tax=Gymnopilus dilepis TaxID=231916 RepID=A0A409WR23_9AGAR|nr:hypothetical protein CVT26_014691 [Gymnopilus dilepis]
MHYGEALSRPNVSGKTYVNPPASRTPSRTPIRLAGLVGRVFDVEDTYGDSRGLLHGGPRDQRRDYQDAGDEGDDSVATASATAEGAVGGAAVGEV